MRLFGLSPSHHFDLSLNLNKKEKTIEDGINKIQCMGKIAGFFNWLIGNAYYVRDKENNCHYIEKKTVDNLLSEKYGEIPQDHIGRRFAEFLLLSKAPTVRSQKTNQQQGIVQKNPEKIISEDNAKRILSNLDKIFDDSRAMVKGTHKSYLSFSKHGEVTEIESTAPQIAGRRISDEENKLPSFFYGVIINYSPDDEISPFTYNFKDCDKPIPDYFKRIIENTIENLNERAKDPKKQKR